MENFFFKALNLKKSRFIIKNKILARLRIARNKLSFTDENNY